MENTNNKFITMSFLIFSFICAFCLHMLLQAFAGAFGVVARLVESDAVKHGLPVVFGLGLFVFLQFNKKVLAWADEVIVEIKKVVWPSRRDTTAMTIVVCVMVLISSVIVSAFDLVSGYVINVLIK